MKKSNIEYASALHNEAKIEVDMQLFESLPLSNFIKVYEQSEGRIQNLH